MKITHLFVAAAVSLASTFSIGALASSPCENAATYKEVSRVELASLVEKKQAFVVDVNGEESFQKHHVPTAIHFETNRAKFAQLLPKEKTSLIVAYCGGPKCNAWKEAAEEACKLGYTNVRHFKGGISGWVAGEAATTKKN